MAHSTKPPSAVRVKLAVHLRRCGSTWRAVGFELGCSPETVRQWPRIYPNEWRTAVREDVQRCSGEAEGEVIGSLRMMLKDRRKMIRLRAARALIAVEMGRKWSELEAIEAESPRASWRERALAILQERSHVELKLFGELCLQLAEDMRNSAQPVRPSAV